jgi:hypothetical protein
MGTLARTPTNRMVHLTSVSACRYIAADATQLARLVGQWRDCRTVAEVVVCGGKWQAIAVFGACT